MEQPTLHVTSWRGALHAKTPRLLLVAMLVGAVACSLAVQTEREQCMKNEDCLHHGLSVKAACIGNVCTEPSKLVDQDAGDTGAPPNVDPTWGCLGQIPPLPVLDPTTPVKNDLRFVGVSSGKPLAGLPVKVCTLLDLDCAQPTAGTPTTTDDEGLVQLRLPSGFLGYLEVAPSPDTPDLIPTLFYLLPVPNKDAPQKEPGSIALMQREELSFLVGNRLNPDYGHLIFGALDCSGKAAANVIVRADPISSETLVAYNDSRGFPSLTQAQTSEAGLGTYVNLPPGSINLTYTRDTGQPIGKHNVSIRKGGLTIIVTGPTP